MQIVGTLRVLGSQQIFLHHLEFFRIVFARRFISRSWDNADNRHRRSRFIRCLVIVDVLTNWIFPGEIFSGERVIDDD